MPTRSKKRALYIAAESAFSTDPDQDGSDYTAVFTQDLSFVDPGNEPLETNYYNGRNTTTAGERGNDSAAITFSTPAIGLAAAAGDGTAASSNSDDWFDLLMNNAFGANVSTTGEGVQDSATTSASVLDLDTDAFNDQDVIAIQDSTYNSGYAEIRRLGGDPDPYSLHRNFGGTPPDAAVAYGAKHWRGPVDGGGGSYLSASVVLDDLTYLLTGGRMNSLGFSMTAGQLAQFTYGMQFNDRLEDATNKTSLAAISTFSGSPIKGQLGTVAWGATEYAVGSVSIDFGLQTSEIQSVAGAQGRSNIHVMSAHPTVTITPLYATVWDTDFTAGTNRTLEVKIGSGSVSGGVMNCLSFFAEAAEVMAPPAGQDDNNHPRQSVQFAVRDAGTFVGTTAAHYFQLSRF